MKQKQSYLTWSILIFTVLISLFLHQWVFSTFIYLVLAITHICSFSAHSSDKLSLDDSKASKTAWWIPLLVGGVVTIFHFGLSYFLFEPGTHSCSNSDRSMISPYFLIPGWFISSFPNIEKLIDSLDITYTNRYYVTMSISSFYFGFASSLLGTNRKPYLQIGIVLWVIALFLGDFLIWADIVTGCGA